MTDQQRERFNTVYENVDNETLVQYIEADQAAMRALERTEAKHNETTRMFLVVICLAGLVGWASLVSWAVIIGLKVFP